MRFTKYLLGSKLIDEKNKEIGTVTDLVIDTSGKKAVVSFIIVDLFEVKTIGKMPLVSPVKHLKLMIPWSEVGSFKDYKEKKIKLKTDFKNINFRDLKNEEILVKEHILDQQILDSRGIGLRRPSDIVFIEDDDDLILAGLIVGLPGIIEQLGVEWPAQIAHKLLSLGEDKYQEEIIPWHYMVKYKPKKKQMQIRHNKKCNEVKKIHVSNEDEEIKKIIHHKS